MGSILSKLFGGSSHQAHSSVSSSTATSSGANESTNKSTLKSNKSKSKTNQPPDRGGDPKTPAPTTQPSQPPPLNVLEVQVDSDAFVQEPAVYTTTLEAHIDRTPPHPLEQSIINKNETIDTIGVNTDNKPTTIESDINDAVVKIQAGVRGFLVRKQLNQGKKDFGPDERETEQIDVYSSEQDDSSTILPPPDNFTNFNTVDDHNLMVTTTGANSQNRVQTPIPSSPFAQDVVHSNFDLIPDHSEHLPANFQCENVDDKVAPIDQVEELEIFKKINEINQLIAKSNSEMEQTDWLNKNPPSTQVDSPVLTVNTVLDELNNSIKQFDCLNEQEEPEEKIVLEPAFVDVSLNSENLSGVDLSQKETLSTDDPEKFNDEQEDEIEENRCLLTEEDAAIRIQAAFRGYGVRKSLSREHSPVRREQHRESTDSTGLDSETEQPKTLQSFLPQSLTELANNCDRIRTQLTESTLNRVLEQLPDKCVIDNLATQAKQGLESGAQTVGTVLNQIGTSLNTKQTTESNQDSQQKEVSELKPEVEEKFELPAKDSETKSTTEEEVIKQVSFEPEVQIINDQLNLENLLDSGVELVEKLLDLNTENSSIKSTEAKIEKEEELNSETAVQPKSIVIEEENVSDPIDLEAENFIKSNVEKIVKQVSFDPEVTKIIDEIDMETEKIGDDELELEMADNIPSEFEKSSNLPESSSEIRDLIESKLEKVVGLVSSEPEIAKIVNLSESSSEIKDLIGTKLEEVVDLVSSEPEVAKILKVPETSSEIKDLVESKLEEVVGLVSSEPEVAKIVNLPESSSEIKDLIESKLEEVEDFVSSELEIAKIVNLPESSSELKDLAKSKLEEVAQIVNLSESSSEIKDLIESKFEEVEDFVSSEPKIAKILKVPETSSEIKDLVESKLEEVVGLVSSEPEVTKILKVPEISSEIKDLIESKLVEVVDLVSSTKPMEQIDSNQSAPEIDPLLKISLKEGFGTVLEPKKVDIEKSIQELEISLDRDLLAEEVDSGNVISVEPATPEVESHSMSPFDGKSVPSKIPVLDRTRSPTGILKDSLNTVAGLSIPTTLGHDETAEIGLDSDPENECDSQSSSPIPLRSSSPNPFSKKRHRRNNRGKRK